MADLEEVQSMGWQTVGHNYATFTFTFRGGSLAVENFANKAQEVHLKIGFSAKGMMLI